MRSVKRLAVGGLDRGGAVLVALSLLVSGCAAPSPFVRPALPTPPTFPGTPTDQASIGRLGWRDFFQDPQLQGLITTALTNNRDVRIAAGRLDEARAGLRIESAALYPRLDGVATSTRGRTPADLSFTGRAVTAGEYRSVLSASWEVDFWGRLRASRQAALEQYLATDEARRAVATSLIAQVANAYLLERAYQERIALARRTVASREESLRILRRRYEVGAGSKLEMTQAQTLLSQARTAVEALSQDQEINRHALAVLAGQPVAMSSGALALSAVESDQPLPAGLPSDLLVNRPDIIAAEHRLRATSANITAARAAFFPNVTLTAAGGTASAQLDGLFQGGSRAWSFKPTLDLPIFDAGARKANLDLSEARRDTAVADYERTVQAAFRDVSDALAQRRQLAAQIVDARDMLAALRERARLADLRFANGRSTYLEVQDAQRDLFETEQAVVQLRLGYLASGVALYAALGGGLGDEGSLPPSNQTLKEKAR
ncbi:efflux transporter outer membrane subunit [Caulobacter sp.]|uniref:efflux transporter outer membrane subunit n=1 Tax=Caulobacter sp. TaxID=78 RepID=UPI002B4A99E5|nr:efflux transporter outer membrane subunit [Caulobacter sp.]HJV40086.1 efflux transporter outer membrane subunit [Caulobacter sp.]